MTIDEAIKHCEEVAENQFKQANAIDKLNCDSTFIRNMAEYHRQLAEWLKDLQELKELLKRTENRVHPTCAECKYMKAEYFEQPCRNCCNNYRSMFERGESR